MTIGERIKHIRMAMGFTQKQLGELSGTSEITIRQYELGKRQPRIEQLQRIADALDMNVSYLLSGGEQVSQTHLENGVHIYKNSFPFKVIEPVLNDFLDRDDIEILYQDEYLIIVVEKGSSATKEELDSILSAYVPMELLKEKLRNSGPFYKMSDAEAYRAGFLQFHSAEDRIAHFYRQLTDEGKIAAGGYFFRHLDKDSLSDVANYVMGLSENPLYQRITISESPPAPQEGKDTAPPSDAPETPPEGK